MAKKVKRTTTRFGPRYGRTVKRRLSEIESMAKKAYKCPYCASNTVKKKMAGIWGCRKCGKVFTARAYSTEMTKL